MKKVTAIVGSYRKNGIVDQAVDAVLDAARRNGAQVRKIYLTEKRIEFCTNCRACTDDNPEKRRGKCVFNDGMEGILSEIDSSDGLVLGSPVNFGEVTALMKRFGERLIAYTYWPWGELAPANRIKKQDKKAVLITSSSCPALLGRLIMPCALRTMKKSAELVGAKAVKSLYLGDVCREREKKLSAKQLASAASAARVLN